MMQIPLAVFIPSQRVTGVDPLTSCGMKSIVGHSEMTKTPFTSF